MFGSGAEIDYIDWSEKFEPTADKLLVKINNIDLNLSTQLRQGIIISGRIEYSNIMFDDAWTPTFSEVGDLVFFEKSITEVYEDHFLVGSDHILGYIAGFEKIQTDMRIKRGERRKESIIREMNADEERRERERKKRLDKKAKKDIS